MGNDLILVTIDQWAMGNDLILVTIDQGPGQVPHGDHGSAGECQLGVNERFLSKTGTKSVKFCLNSAKKVFNFRYVELKNQKNGKLSIIYLKNRNKLSHFLSWIVIQ